MGPRPTLIPRKLVRKRGHDGSSSFAGQFEFAGLNRDAGAKVVDPLIIKGQAADTAPDAPAAFSSCDSAANVGAGNRHRFDDMERLTQEMLGNLVSR